MTKEIASTLSGGPHDGMYVEASVSRIPVAVTTEMWLDGKSSDKDVNQEVITGEYVWSEERKRFIWHMYTTTWYKRKKED